MLRACVLALIVFTGASVAGQAGATSVRIGTPAPGQGNCLPFMCNISGTSSGQTIDYEQVYASSAFSSPMDVSSLTFYESAVGGSDTLLGGTYDFYLSTTGAAVNGLGTNLGSNLGSDNTEVLSVTIPARGTSFGNSYTFNLSRPFDYNPDLGNLLLDVIVWNQDNVPNGDGNGSDEVDYSGTQTSRADYFASDGYSAADSGGLVTTLGSTTSVPEPGSLVLFAAGLLGLARSQRRRFVRAP